SLGSWLWLRNLSSVRSAHSRTTTSRAPPTARGSSDSTARPRRHRPMSSRGWWVYAHPEHERVPAGPVRRVDPAAGARHRVHGRDAGKPDRVAGGGGSGRCASPAPEAPPSSGREPVGAADVATGGSAQG